MLSDCDCGSACYKCLKHYRNQITHGVLDRFAALQLLEWGTAGKIARDLPLSEQKRLIAPLESILDELGRRLSHTADGMTLNSKQLIVYPAMWKEPEAANTIFISDADVKYSKPQAVKKLTA